MYVLLELGPRHDTSSCCRATRCVKVSSLLWVNSTELSQGAVERRRLSFVHNLQYFGIHPCLLLRGYVRSMYTTTHSDAFAHNIYDTMHQLLASLPKLPSNKVTRTGGKPNQKSIMNEPHSWRLFSIFTPKK